MATEKNFEDQWKDAFEGASLPPPDDLWNKIETELDQKEKRRPFVFFWTNPRFLASGIAAALLLAVSGLFLINQTPNETRVSNDIKKDSSINKNQLADNKIVTPEKSTKNKNKNHEKPQSKSELISVNNTEKPTTLLANINEETTLLRSKIENEAIVVSEENSIFLAETADFLEKITSKDFDFYGNRFTMNRPFLPFEISEPTENKLANNSSKSWIGMHSGVAPFQPNFSSSLNTLALNSAEEFSADKNNFKTQTTSSGLLDPNGKPPFGTTITPDSKVALAQPVTTFNRGRSINFGLRFGKQLSKKVAIESGLQYLQNSSTMATNAFSFDEKSGEVGSFYQNYISKEVNYDNTVVSAQETILSTYNYVIVPVEIVYQLPIWKQLSAEAFAGASADIFLQNHLESNTTETIDLKASNSHFKPLNASGLGGIRLSYLFQKKWQFSAGSTVRQSLFSSLKTGEESISFRPRTVGFVYGLNYKF